jgi:hypothetical protein
MALALTWGGRADVHVDFAEFFAGDHTVTARFMLQFVHVYAGPILAVHGGGRYFVGLGDFRSGGDHLLVQVAGGELKVPIDASFQGTWHHLALVRSGGTITVYLDGSSAGSFAVGASDTPTGDLWLGRGDAVHQQFYGLVDDVAIFSAAKSAAAVQALAAADSLTGSEADLLAGYTFGEGGSIPAAARRDVDLVPGARQVRVATPRGPGDADKLPLSLTSHMRLPLPEGKVASLSQAFADPTISHTGYAAFCYDFVFPSTSCDGYVFRAAAPGEVAHVWEGGPNTSQGPSNFVSVEQAPGEFADYLHLRQNSAPVAVGDAIGYGDELGEIGRSGTGVPHLHLAVTNLGEHTTDRAHFVTIPAPFCNYEVSDDQGASWRHVIRGYPRKGQWVRNPTPRSPIRYTSAWSKSQESEVQIYDVSYARYRAKYDALWPKGWRLHALSIVTVDGVPRYTAVWRRGAGGELQIYDATYAQYRAKYDALWPQGWRLKLIDVGVRGGEPRYTAAFAPETCGEFQIYGATYAQFKKRYDEIWSKGWRLRHLATYDAGAGPRITAVWRHTAEPELWVHGWEYADLRARYDVLWQQGWRLKVFDRYVAS